MKNTNKVILALDASNGFDNIDRKETLELIHQRLPEIYLTAFNTYGAKSYTVINDSTIPVEQGSCQGCPLGGTFFNIGLIKMIDYLEDNLEGIQL